MKKIITLAIGCILGSASQAQPAAAPTNTSNVTKFVPAAPCGANIATPGVDAKTQGEQFARGMIDCVKDSSTPDGIKRVSANFSNEPTQTKFYSADVLPVNEGNAHYDQCKAEVNNGFKNTPLVEDQRSCEAIVYAIEAMGKSNPYKINAKEQIFDRAKEAEKNSGTLSGGVAASRVTTSCTPGNSTTTTSLGQDFCEIIAKVTPEICDVKRVVEVSRFTQYQCDQTADIKSSNLCKIPLKCTRDTGCADKGVLLDSVVADMAISKVLNVDGSISITYGTIADNYWSTNFYGYDRKLTFGVNGKDRITQFDLTRSRFDDYMSVSVNGVLVYNGPDGGDRLFYYDGSADVNVAYASYDSFVGIWNTNVGNFAYCKTMSNAFNEYTSSHVCNDVGDIGVHTDGSFSAKNPERGTQWDIAQKVNLLPYLKEGTNEVDIRVIVAGGGEGAIVMTASQTCPLNCVPDESACLMYKDRVVP